MKLLVTGSRDYSDSQTMFRVLGGLARQFDVQEIIHGGAKGADVMAGDWACCFGIPVRVFRADWAKYGKAAGPVRNTFMLAEGQPDLVVAFSSGHDLTPGTRSMVAKAVAARVRTYVVIDGALYTHDGHAVVLDLEGAL